MHDPTAIDVYGLPCHTVAQLTGQKESRAGDVDGQNAALETLRCHKGSDLFLGYNCFFRFDENSTRSNAVDMYVVLADLTGERTC